MLHDIARVFSSQGVLLPGAEKVAVSGRGAAKPACDHQGPECRCFGPKFDQAAAKLELSRRGRALQAGPAGGNGASPAGEGAPLAEGSRAAGAEKTGAEKRGADGKPLGEDDRKQVRELEKRDREVKAHEAAHQAAAGGQARGGAAFEYQTGPDGKQYAVGGHVDIDVSPVEGNPHATLAKAMTAQRAALAPADPSGQDRAVAAAAAQMALKAQQEIAQGGSGAGKAGDGREEGAGGNGSGGKGGNTASEGRDGEEAVRAARIRNAYRRAPVAGAALSVYA